MLDAVTRPGATGVSPVWHVRGDVDQRSRSPSAFE